MLAPTQGSFPLPSRPLCEIAIARSLMRLLEDCIAAADVRGAADLAEQLADHLRRLEGRG